MLRKKNKNVKTNNERQKSGRLFVLYYVIFIVAHAQIYVLCMRMLLLTRLHTQSKKFAKTWPNSISLIRHVRLNIYAMKAS